jgi:hypothetical protein
MRRSIRNRKASMIVSISVSMRVASLFSAGCDIGNRDDVEKETNDNMISDTPFKPDSENSEAPYTTALVVTTDRSDGAYAAISLEDNDIVVKDINPIHSDAICRFDPLTNTPFILQRLGVDAVLVLDAEDFDIAKEYSVVADSNPHDIALVTEKKAYISRFGSPMMLTVNPFSGEALGTVDFSDYADDDGIPEVSGLAQLNGKIYASVERLDRDDGWTAVGGGVIVVIDAEKGEIEGEVKLTGTHGYGAPEYSDAVEKFVIAEPGSWSDLENAGLEYFDPEDERVSGFFITEEALGGNVTKGLVVSEEKGYALVGVEGESGSNTHIVTFNPKTGEKRDTILKAEGWKYDDIALTPDGAELWVSDRTAEADGIRIFKTETDAEKTAIPINVGLPPSHICFTR